MPDRLLLQNTSAIALYSEFSYRLDWIIEHGIRMTGMPAFGRTHRPETIWSLVGFIRQLPNITPQQYQDMVQAAELTGDHVVTEDEGHEE